jgi:hypothetical protein
LDEVAAFVILTYLIYVIGITLRFSQLGSGLAALLSVIPWGLQMMFFRTPWLPVGWMALALLILYKMRRRMDGQDGIVAPGDAWFSTGLMLALAAASLLFRWRAIELVLFKVLMPDVQGFRAIALSMKSLYDTEMREPVFIWFLRAVFALFPPLDLNIRMVSLVGSVLMIPMTFHVGKRLGGMAMGLVGAVFLAASPTLIDYCSEGERLEWVCVSLLLVAWAFIPFRGRVTVFQAAAMGLAAAFACLLRLTFLHPLIVISVIFIIARRWPLRSLIIFFICFLAPIIPHLQNNRRQEGLNDPFYSINIHARYYRNQEFAGRPGYPTHEELKERAYAGSMVNAFQFMFGMHDAKTILDYTMEGFRRTFFTFYMQGRLAPWWVWRWLFWLGALLVLLRPWGRWLVLLMLFSIGGVLFLAGRPAPLFLDYRLVVHVFPFVALCIGGGVAVVIKTVAQIIALKKGTVPLRKKSSHPRRPGKSKKP